MRTAIGVLDMPVTFQHLLTINLDGTQQFWNLNPTGGLEADLSLSTTSTGFSATFTKLQLHLDGLNESSPTKWTFTNIPLSAQGIFDLNTGAVSVTIPDLFQLSFNIFTFNPDNPLAGVTYGFLNGNTSFVPHVLRGADTITGSSGNDYLLGHAGNDMLKGGLGNDMLKGGLGNDILNGGLGTDTASYASAAAGVMVNLGLAAAQNTVGAGSDTLTSIENLTGSAFNDTLTGNSGNNVLNGGGGNDTLNGGLGNDTMIGGAGNDTYARNATGDMVTEGFNAGTDTVQSAVTYILGDNVEKLTLTGAAAINGTGNTLNNVLTGNSGNNMLNGSTGIDTLIGNAGNDTLIGGGGNDTLTGGAGADSYLFSSALGATNIDQVMGFSVVDDTIRLENAVFTRLLSTGALAPSHLRKGAGITTAADADDHLIYNTTTGALYYDADANGPGLAKQFATLVGVHPVLTAADFQVV